MKKLFIGILLCGFIGTINAQTAQPVDTTDQYKLINTVVEEQRIGLKGKTLCLSIDVL